jgi:hypothetical protein
MILLLLGLLQDWPTLHGDAQRSGYSATVVEGPYERKWYRDFHDEMIASRVEAVVADGLCYVGTFNGTLHALDVVDGQTRWTFKAGGAVGHSPLWHQGTVYVASEAGLHAVKDGARIWTYPGLFWTSPATDGKSLYLGDRAGVFHAVDLPSGRRAWTMATGGPILAPASIAEDGTIVFASEDMHVRAVSSDGKLRWTSKKLPGVSLRDHPPAIWKGLAIVRSAPADGFHEVMNRNQDLLARTQKAIPLGAADKVVDDKHGAYILRPNPDRMKPEQDAVVAYLAENPHDRTFFALSLEDGAEPWTSPVLYTCGLHNPPTAPTFRGDDLYTYYRSSLTNWSRGVRPFTALGRVDRATGRIQPLAHAQGDDPGWSPFASIGDETQALSRMGDVLLSTHQGTIGGLKLADRTWVAICSARDTYGGIFGPGALPGGWDAEKRMQREGWLVNMPNEWHGPDKSVLAVAARRFFWLTGSQVVCWGGPDTPKAGTGGTKVPPPIRKRFERVVVCGGNVTADRVGGVDASVVRKAVAVDDVRWVLDDPKPGPVDVRLDAAALEVTEGPWAPFIVQLGISKEERHFWRTAQTIRVLSLALPRLSDGVRAKVKEHLGLLFDGPLLHAPEARRRELYDLGPGMRRFAAAQVSPGAQIEDLYAGWAYARHADAWEKVLCRMPDYRKLFDAAKPERLNAAIAGAIGYARMANRAGEKEEVERALVRLAQLTEERVHLERADSNFVRASKDAHYASIPRYEDLVPETVELLRRLAGPELARNLKDLTEQMPVWHQAFAERMIGGENYTHTPRLAWGLYLAGAGGPERLDLPWCRADLYYLEKLLLVK